MKEIIPAFYEGFKHKPETNFGNMKEYVKHFRPEYKNANYCECQLSLPISKEPSIYDGSLLIS